MHNEDQTAVKHRESKTYITTMRTGGCNPGGSNIKFVLKAKEK
jgi:hypothetical protein